MIHRLQAIALLAIRAALRSRVVLMLGALLLLTVVGLPVWIRGDGTPQGTFTLLVGHTLTACFVILAATALWAGCAAMAIERHGGVATLTAAKPVHPLQLWLGKWLGLTLLATIMLTLTLLTLLLRIHYYGNTAIPADWQRCNLIIAPDMPKPEIEADLYLKKLAEAGKLPTDTPISTLMADIIREINNRYEIINPGNTKTWHFNIPPHPTAKPGDPLLRATFETQHYLRNESQLSITVAASDSPPLLLNDNGAVMAGEPLLTTLPAAVITPGAPLAATFSLSATATEPLFIHPGRNLALLLPGINFTANLCRTGIIMAAILALFTAIGLTLGSCFSFPVASFAATAFVMLTMIGACVYDDQTPLQDEPPIERAGWHIIRTATIASRPLFAAAPVKRLVSNEEIPLHDVAQPLVTGLIYAPALLALFSTVILRRKEVEG